MKTKLVVLAIVLMTSNVMFAQDTIKVKTLKVGNYSLTDVTISSGKGALTSGFDTRFDFSNDHNIFITLQANNDRANIMIGKKWGNFKAIASLGSYKNIPWIGPMFLYTLGPLDFTVWNGIGFAKTNQFTDVGYKPEFFFSYEGAGVTLGKNRISGAVMWFATDPMNWFASYKRNFTLGQYSTIFAEVTYNHTLNIPMFVIGYSRKLK